MDITKYKLCHFLNYFTLAIIHFHLVRILNLFAVYAGSKGQILLSCLKKPWNTWASTLGFSGTLYKLIGEDSGILYT